MAAYENPEDGRSDLVRSLLRWWLGKCRGEIPDRGDLDPAALVAWRAQAPKSEL